jgi:hypothetical protein
MAGIPESYILKLNRAHKHLERLQAEIDEWAGPYERSVTHEPDADRAGYTAFYVDVPTPPSDFSLRISEFLHNLRSGLDSLAFALANAYTDPLPLDVIEQSEFPIFGDEGWGKDRRRRGAMGRVLFQRGKSKIRAWHPEAQTIVETLQPYHRGYGFRLDPLWRLQELNIMDKHRLLFTTAAVFNGITVVRDEKANWTELPGQWESHAGPLEGRTKVASLRIKPLDPSREMHVDAVAPIYVVFGAGTKLVQGSDVIEVLADIYNHVTQRVVAALASYL